jgi:hypothetical protein
MVQQLNNIPDNYHWLSLVETGTEKGGKFTWLADSDHGGCSRGTATTTKGKGLLFSLFCHHFFTMKPDK